jgi:signal transduction histidine kinase
VYWLSNHASTSLVLTVVTGRRYHDLFVEALVPAAAGTAVSAGLGITVVVLFAASPFAPVLLLPLAVVAYAAFRAVAAQRAESLRFKRLYEASSRTSSLRGINPTLAAVADAARSLVGGTVALAAAPDEYGRWTGVVVGDGASVEVDEEVVDALRARVSEGAVELAVHDVDVALAHVAPGARDVVIAPAGGALEAIVAVFREITDDRRDTRIGVLTAFAGHAALAASNARLFDELEASLRAQIDLNRQKDNFLAAVSHELRTPLTSVLGSVGTLRQHAAILNDDKREMLYEIAERQGLKLKRLIEDLLLVAAAESGAAAVHIEPVEVKPFLARIASELRDDADVVIKPSAPRVVLTDPSRVRQIMEAVIENATKFAPGPLELIAAVDETDLVLHVRDHGPGIPDGDRERVFERFVQLDQSATRRHGGTGTGLYLCRQLADLLGGELAVTETPGGGATFSLVLPDYVPRPGEPERAIAMRPSTTDHDHVPAGGPQALRHRAPASASPAPAPEDLQ